MIDEEMTAKINMSWYPAISHPHSLCQFCFDFAYNDRCTKPNIERAKITPRPVKCSSYGDDTYYVEECPYFVYRGGAKWQKISLMELKELTSVGVPVLRKLSVEDINKIICKINCECDKIKSQLYIRSIHI